MVKRTKKVGLSGKWGTRQGASLRKIAKRLSELARAKQFCNFCGEWKYKRECLGIFHCKKCNKTYSGGAYTMTTDNFKTVKASIARLRKNKEISNE